MPQLFKKLGEDFDSRIGQLDSYYLNTIGNAFTPNTHEDIRSFHSDDLNVPRTMLDMRFWNASSFDGQTMIALNSRVSTQGRTFRGRTIAEVEAMTGANLELSDMGDLDQFVLDIGNEEWPAGTTAKDATRRYDDVLTINLVGTTAQTITSYYNDDILTGLQDSGHDYYIEFPILISVPPSTAAVSTSGGEITDAVRTAAIQGDGRATDSSFGLWPASTNLWINGGAETNASTITPFGGTSPSVTQDATVHKFGTKSFLLSSTVYPAPSLGIQNTTEIAVSPSTTYTATGWIAGAGAPTYVISITWKDAAHSTISGVVGTTSAIPSTFTTRYSFTATSPSNAAFVVVKYGASGGGGPPSPVNLDGLQFERQPIATPYIETTNAQASRSAPDVRISSSTFSPTQGWIMTKIRPGWASTDTTVGAPTVIELFGNSTNFLRLIYTAGSGWQLIRSDSSGSDTVTVANAHSASATLTIVATWTATDLSLSINGGAFTTITSTHIPSVALSRVQVGALDNTGSNVLFGDMFWLAWGRGTLLASDASAATGYNDPASGTFTTTQDLRGLWYANTTSYNTYSPNIDIDNSFVDFSSDSLFDPSVTDSISLRNSLTTLVANTNQYFSINRNVLTKADLSNLKGIRFRLQPITDAQIIIRNMRLIRNDYIYREIEIDTKRAQFSRSTPRDGGSEPSSTLGILFFDTSRPKNITEYIRFNSGHNPVGVDNTIILYARYTDANNWISVELDARSTQSRLKISERLAGVTTTIFQTLTLTNILTPETEYFLVAEFKDNQVRASISLARSVFIPSTSVYTTGWQTVTGVRRGYVGFDFQPYNYDFVMDYIRPSATEFATHIEKPFLSVSPVAGSNLYTNASPVANILDETTFVDAGDATLSTNAGTGRPAPSSQILRVGNQWYGGFESADLIDIVNAQYVTLTGDIYPMGIIRGLYRIALLDKNGSVAYLGYIQDLTPNGWNHFEMPIQSNIVPNGYYVLVHNTGYRASPTDPNYPYTFLLDNVALQNDRIGWEASADTVNFVPFYHTINQEFGGVNFGGNRGTQLQIKARVLTDEAWIDGFEAKPKYSYTGHRPITLTPKTNVRTQDLRTIGQSTSNRPQDFRITGA